MKQADRIYYGGDYNPDQWDEQTLRDMADEMPEIEVCCHFCNAKYHFTPQEVRQMAEKRRPPLLKLQLSESLKKWYNSPQRRSVQWRTS